MHSSFGRAQTASGDGGSAALSELSAATTAFVPQSVVESLLRSDLGPRARSVLAAASPQGAEKASPKKKQNYFQQSLPYRTEQESSVVSDWRGYYQNTVGKGLAFQRGLRFVDPRYANENSPGVCVIKGDDDVPKVPGLSGNAGTFKPTAEKQKVIDAINTQLLQMGVVLTDPTAGRTLGENAKMLEEQSMQNTRQSFIGEKNGSTRELRGSRASSEASLASSSRESRIDRRKNRADIVARDRYQTLVLAPQPKGHTFCEPELPTGFNAEVARQVYGM
jgi:hypothetical protein